MKAVNIMLFLLIFNVVVSLVGGLNIYNMGMSSSEYDYEALADESTSPQRDKDAGGGIFSSFTDANFGFNTFFIGGTTVAILIGGAIAGATIGGLVTGGRLKTSEGAAYGFFGSIMTITFISSYSILWTIVEQIPDEIQTGAAVAVGLFLAITGFMFILGFMQLIVGGIAQYQ